MGTSPFWMRTKAKTKGQNRTIYFVTCSLPSFCTTGMAWGLPQGSQGRPASSPFCIV